jgi:hypothetical protein
MEDPFILHSPRIPASSSSVPHYTNTDENETVPTSPHSTRSNTPDYDPEGRAYYERHGGPFRAFLHSCGIAEEDQQTRTILDRLEISDWTVFMHTTLDDYLHWGLELTAAQRLVRGGRKVILAMEELDFNED